ncbi:MAG: hybrid sensor histidine kinase/response regulator, partial [Psychrosphaera sp.]|nr:hybrid sensor histidine kinase/response regulator [Psychrosphaera sp.]
SNLYEILLANDIVHPVYFNKDGPAAFAVGIFVLTQTWLLATRHCDTLNAKTVSELANVEKNRFFAAASHDLRQPIYALQLLHSVLQEKVLEEQVLQEKVLEEKVLKNKLTTTSMSGIINDIHKNTEQLENLVESLLEIAQIDQSGLKVARSHLPMQSFLQALTCEYAVQAQAKGLEFEVIPTTLYGFSDGKLLARIVGNFLSNAIRYTPSGKITLACRPTAQGLLIEVTDTGPGITADQQTAIFNEFYQLNTTDTPISKGMGLGLSIVKRLANLLKDPINVVSTPGQGAIFSVQIEQVAAPLPSKPVNPCQAQTATIVILEDDEQVLNALQRQIEVWGFNTVAATSSAQLQTKLDSRQVVSEISPKLIVSDYRLGNDDNGIDAIKALRQRFDSDIPAIITTGEQQAEIIQRIEQFDCQWCRKPIKPSHLFELIDSQLA